MGLTQEEPKTMELKTTVYSEGTSSAAFSCVLPALLLLCRCAYKHHLCSVPIVVGTVTVWSCTCDNTPIAMRSFSER